MFRKRTFPQIADTFHQMLIVAAGTFQIQRVVFVDSFDVLLLEASEPTHDVKDLVLIHLYPQLHPFSDVYYATTFLHRVVNAFS